MALRLNTLTLLGWYVARYKNQKLINLLFISGPIKQPVIDWRDKHVISYKDFAKMVDKRHIQIIDVREPFELESAGAIENSINIPCKYYFPSL